MSDGYVKEHYHIAYRLPKGLLKLGRRFEDLLKASKAADKERPDRKCVTCGHNSNSIVIVNCTGTSRLHYIDGWYQDLGCNNALDKLISL